MQKQDFKKLFEHGPVILDGATGSNLMKAGMPKGVCTEKWVLEHPDTIIQLQRASDSQTEKYLLPFLPIFQLQRAYAEAGSQIIYAPTFAANRISLANHGLSGQVDHYNHALVALSKEAVQGKALIAGDITTTSKMDAEYDELLSAYEEQITALVDAGVDLLIAETMIGADETMAVIDAAHAVCDLPILCSLTMQADGSLFFGGNIFETAPMLEEMGADAVGINCSTGPDQLENIIQNLAGSLSVPVIAKPNAGMPTINDQGIAVYDMTPEYFGKSMKRLVDLGASMVGGCCGTDPSYIKALVNAIR